MKKFVSLLLGLTFAFGAAYSLGACGGKKDENPKDSSSVVDPPQQTTYTITFKQNNREDVVKEVVEGGTLTDVPTPAPQTGYDVVWDTTDFTNITTNMTVNAVATAKTYTVTFDPNEGSVTPDDQQVKYDEAPAAFPVPTREGYDFIGWKYDGKIVQASDIWKHDGDITLVAEWIAIPKYAVSFVKSDGSIVSVEVQKGGSVAQDQIPSPGEKKGYTVAWEEKDLTDVQGPITVNAIATANTYTVTFDANGGSVTSASQQVKYDEAPAAFPVPTREGYDFVGWKYDGKIVQASDIWKYDENVILVAEWIALTKYAVSFVKSDGTTVSVEVQKGGSVTQDQIPSPGEKKGYTVAWEEKDLTNIQGPITVNAIATANTYTVAFDANEGSVSPTSQQVKYDEAPAAFPVPTREGYDFVGWKYDGKIVQASDIWKYDGDITLVAEWIAIPKYTVSFVKSDGTTVSVEVQKGDSVTEEQIPSPGEKKGYTVAWEEKDLTNVQGSIVVNAIATPNEYEITYDGNGGTPSIATQTVIYDVKPATFATATRDGYEFEGWKYDGNFIYADELWTIDSDVTLTAEWVKLHTVTFKQDGQADKTFTVKDGEKFTEIPDVVEEAGYTIAWNSEELAKLSNVTEDITVTAVKTEKKKTCTITFDVNGGKEQKSITVTYGEAYTLPTATHNQSDDYDFVAWTYEGKTVAQSSTWSIDAENIQLTATWKQAIWIGPF